MSLVVWVFIIAATAVVIAMLQVPLVILPNAFRLRNVLMEKRPDSWESLRLNPDRLLEDTGIRKSRQQIRYWFNDIDCDLPNVMKYKKAVRKATIRILASLVIVLVALLFCGAWMLLQR